MAEEAQEEKVKEEETPEEGGKNNIVIYVLIGVIILLLGIYFISRGSDNPVTKTINIVKKTTPTLTPSPQPETNEILAGTITIEGTTPTGSTLAIAIKSKTNPTFTPAVEQIEVAKTVQWAYDKAVSGNNYEVQAYLISSKEELISQSQIATVKAPNDSIKLAIVYSSDLSKPPANTFEVYCENKDPNTGKWQVNLNHNINNPTSSAKQYRLGVGTSKTGDLLLDVVTKPKSPDTSQVYLTDFIINDNQTYFAAYAYAECSDCNEFSPASTWEEFICTGTPKPSATPTPTPATQ
ncbi:hypothetical protein ACFL0F_01140 [Patescibacteria group bacterium]